MKNAPQREILFLCHNRKCYKGTKKELIADLGKKQVDEIVREENRVLPDSYHGSEVTKYYGTGGRRKKAAT